MTPADLVAVASIGSSLQILQRLHEQQGAGARTCCTAFSAADGTAFAAVDASTAATDEADAAGDRRRDDGRRERAGARHVQQRRAAARAEDARRGAGADSAEEGDPLLQLGHAAQRHRQPGRAARGRQRGRPRERRHLSGRLARPAGRRARRQRAPGQPRRRRARSPAAAWRSSSRSSRRSRRRCTSLASDTGGTAFTDSQRLRRGVHEGREATSRRTTSSASRARTPAKDGRFRRITVRLKNKSNAKARGARGLLRRSRLHAHRQDRSRDRCCRSS